LRFSLFEFEFKDIHLDFHEFNSFKQKIDVPFFIAERSPLAPGTGGTRGGGDRGTYRGGRNIPAHCPFFVMVFSYRALYRPFFAG
jgi:hypothetical protein